MSGREGEGRRRNGGGAKGAGMGMKDEKGVWVKEEI